MLLKRLKPAISSPLARRITLYVIFSSMLVAIFSSGIQLYAEYDRDIERLDETISLIEKTHVSSIANRLWLLNKSDLHSELENIYSLPSIQYVAVYDEDSPYIALGEASRDADLVKTIPLYFYHQDTRQLIGKLFIKISYSDIYHTLLDRALIIIATNSIKTFIVSLLRLVIIYLLFIRHIQALSRFSENLSLDDLDEEFDFDRQPNPPGTEDELDVLLNAYRRMRLNMLLSIESLRERESTFHQFASHVEEVFWVVSRDFNQVHYVNDAFETIWGLPAESLYYDAWGWLKVVHEDDRQQVLDEIPGKDGIFPEIIQFKRFRIIRADGEVRWIKARGYPIYDDNDNVTRVAGIAEDITEIKTSNEMLRRSQKMDSLGQLTSGVAHDYNNMLSIMLGYLDILYRKAAENTELLPYLDKIKHAGERGVQLTGKLLSFTRFNIDSPEVISINQRIHEMEPMLAASMTPRIQVHYHLDEQLWDVKLDPGDLEDAILNLCINALQAMGDEGTLMIRTFNTTSQSVDSADYIDCAAVSITDTGVGMDAETKEHLFEPFFTTKGTDGTGLGLSQVYGLMQRAGGNIRIDSEPGEGTAITLYFPSAIDQKAPLTNADTKTSLKPSHISDTENTILVVDDEDELLALNREILQAAGYDVLTASDGTEAIEVLENHAVDIVVSDIIMPNMDGYKLAQHITKAYPGVRIQLVSGYNEGFGDADIDEELVQTMLKKPYTANELLQRVNLLALST